MLKKEQIEHARLRALAQAIVSKEHAVETFEQYQRAAFPWVETQRKRDVELHATILKQEIGRGPLSIRPLWEKPMRSRLKARVVSSEKRDDSAMNALYDKLGMALPVRR